MHYLARCLQQQWKPVNFTTCWVWIFTEELECAVPDWCGGEAQQLNIHRRAWRWQREGGTYCLWKEWKSLSAKPGECGHQNVTLQCTKHQGWLLSLGMNCFVMSSLARCRSAACTGHRWQWFSACGSQSSPLGVKWHFHRGCLILKFTLLLMIVAKLQVWSWNKNNFMVGVSTTWRTVLRGNSTGKVENCWSMR